RRRAGRRSRRLGTRPGAREGTDRSDGRQRRRREYPRPGEPLHRPPPTRPHPRTDAPGDILRRREPATTAGHGRRSPRLSTPTRTSPLPTLGEGPGVRAVHRACDRFVTHSRPSRDTFAAGLGHRLPTLERATGDAPAGASIPHWSVGRSDSDVSTTRTDLLPAPLARPRGLGGPAGRARCAAGPARRRVPHRLLAARHREPAGARPAA